jgi:hypothetical protein
MTRLAQKLLEGIPDLGDDEPAEPPDSSYPVQQLITISRQDFATGRGLAHDDHITNETFTVVYQNAGEERRVQQKAEFAGEASRDAMDVLYRRWEASHPGEECDGCGGQFIGSMWMEIDPRTSPLINPGSWAYSEPVSAKEMVRSLHDVAEWAASVV